MGLLLFFVYPFVIYHVLITLKIYLLYTHIVITSRQIPEIL